MKKIFCLISTTLTLLGCGQTNTPDNKDQQEQKHSMRDTTPGAKVNLPQNSIHSADLFPLSDAEKILGEPAHLSDSSYTIKKDT
ncbi:MAG: hypothetical protein EPN92_00495, partial [Chitinophagaceae bacterium]